MLIWTIKTAIVSFLFIFLVHHLILFLKSTLTVPKIKDLVNSPYHKYQHIFDTLTNIRDNSPSYSPSYTAIDLLPSTDTNTSINTIGGESNNSMKDELKSFLKGQLHSNDTSEIKPL
jgi:hypothetical protein